MKNLTKILIASSLVAMASCNDEFENPVEEIQVTAGTADFSKYVAIGNSLTAGFMDYALYKSGQENSYPNILAQQMAMAGGGTFIQPMMPDDIGGFSNLGVAGKLVLAINPETGALAPVATPAASPLTMVSGGVNNMGVPGLKSYHLFVPGYGNPAGIATGAANPYFVRFASSPSTTLMNDIVAQNPTFFTMWVGANDVLSYATSGGTGVNQAGNTDLTTYGPDDITDPAKFAEIMTGAVHTLTNVAGAKGAIANIPSITDIPYFTTVPHAPLSPANQSFAAQIPALNALYGQLNAIFEYLGQPGRKISFSTDAASAVVIKDESLADLSTQIAQVMMSQGVPAATAQLMGMTYGQARQATSNDLLVLTSQSVIGQVDTARVQQLMAMGVSQEQAVQLSISGLTYPLEDKWVLIPSEIQQIETATAAFNNTINQLALQYDLALIDAKGAMKQLSSESGIVYFGNTYTTTFVSGGAFSLDGIHLTSKGYAIVANYFIDAINKKFGSTLRNVNPNNYPGVVIP